MRKAVHPLLRRFIGKPAILDTNILLFYWCSDFDLELIGTFKRINSFVAQDVALLKRTLSLFSALRTTPHVLTEVSNLANALPKWQKEAWSEFFAKHIEVLSEEWIPATEISHEPAFSLGLTDAGLYKLASDNVIMTIDFPLSNYLESKQLNVVNFTHLRGLEE
jgi:hypothetical protein